MNYYEMEKIKHLENIEAVTLEILGELKEISGVLKEREEAECVYALEDNVKEALTQHCEELAESDIEMEVSEEDEAPNKEKYGDCRRMFENCRILTPEEIETVFNTSDKEEIQSDIEMEVPEEDEESTECIKGTYTDAEIELMHMAKFVGVELGDERPNFCELWGDVLGVTLKKMNRLARETWCGALSEDEEPEIIPLKCSEDKEYWNKLQQSLWEAAGVPKEFLTTTCPPSGTKTYQNGTTTLTESEFVCPKCGKQMYRESKILTSNPPKRQYTCLNCYHVEYQYI